MPSSAQRVVIIGTGGIARAHVTAVRANEPAVELVGAMDIDPQRVEAFGQEHDIPAYYTDADELLAEAKPDIVLIATPPSSHADLSVQSMEAGAWVLCEKPLCASLAEFDRIEQAEARTGNYTSSVFQWRFGSAGQHLKRLAESDEMGRLLLCNSIITWYRSDAYYAVPWRGKWETEVGGTSMTHGIHAMDFVLWIMGEWAEVRGQLGTLNHDIEVEDVSMASVRFANGALANMTNSAVSPREVSYVRFDFEAATVEVTNLYRYRNEHWRYSGLPDGENEADVTHWANIGENVESSHAAQLSAFLAAKARNERPPVSGPDVRGTLEFLTALYKSGMTGQAVLRGSITSDDPFYYRMCGPCDGAWQRR